MHEHDISGFDMLQHLLQRKVDDVSVTTASGYFQALHTRERSVVFRYCDPLHAKIKFASCARADLTYVFLTAASWS